MALRITRGASESGVQVTRQRLAYAGGDETEDEQEASSPVDIAIYVPPVVPPPIVIAAMPDLADMLAQGTVAEFAAGADILGVIVNPTDQVDIGFLNALAEASDSDVVIALRGESL